MKRLIFIFFIFISVIACGQTNKQSITWLRAEDITNTRYFIWRGDTIDFNFLNTAVFQKDSTKLYITLKQLKDSLNAQAGTHDAVTLDASAITGGLSLSGQKIGFQPATISQNGYLKKEDWVSFNNKISYVAHDESLLGNGTELSPLKVDMSIVAERLWVIDNFLSIDGNLEGTFDGNTSNYYLDYNNFTNVPNIPVISNVAFDASWDGNMDGATKNTIYDAIQSIGIDSYYFEKELSAEEDNVDVGFTLNNKCAVFLNGQALSQSLWSGTGTVYLSLDLDIEKYDMLIVKQ